MPKIGAFQLNILKKCGKLLFFNSLDWIWAILCLIFFLVEGQYENIWEFRPTLTMNVPVNSWAMMHSVR